MESELLALTGVKEVLPHWKTSSVGRWNLLTHTKVFSDVMRYIDANITLLYEKYLPHCQHISQRNEYPATTVCTKAPHSMDYDSDIDKSYFQTVLMHTASSTMMYPRVALQSPTNHQSKPEASPPLGRFTYLT
jgi:hypothetical protein